MQKFVFDLNTVNYLSKYELSEFNLESHRMKIKHAATFLEYL